MKIENRFKGIMQESASQTPAISANPYSGTDAVKLNTIKRTISGMLDEINGILPLMPTSFHSVKAHLETHYVQVTSVLATLPNTSQDVITDSLLWESDILPHNPNIVYHVTLISALSVSIHCAEKHGYRYVTTEIFQDSHSVIAVYSKPNTRNLSYAVNEGSYSDYKIDAMANGAVWVTGIPF